MKVVHPGKSGQAVGCDTQRRDRRIARMNIHKNARLTPPGRLLLVQRIEGAGWRLAEAAIAAGVSQRQSYRWLARDRSGGAGGRGERRSAPPRCEAPPGAGPAAGAGGVRRERRWAPRGWRARTPPGLRVAALP